MRSTEDLLRDAGDRARQSELLLGLAASLLFVVWLSLAQHFSPAPHLHKSAYVSAQAAPATPTPHHKRRDTRSSGGRFRSYCSPDANDSAGAKANPGLSTCIRLHLYSQARHAAAVALNNRLLSNEKKLIETAKVTKDAGQRSSILKTIHRNRPVLNGSAAATTATARETEFISDRIKQTIDFKISEDVALPVGLQYAPPLWLILLIAVLARIAQQRSAFWDLVVRAVHRPKDPGQDKPEPQVWDMPFWLAPGPATDAQEARALIGWTGPAWLHALPVIVVAVVIAGAALRVAWIAANIDSFEVDVTSGWAAAAEHAVNWTTQLACVVALVMLALAVSARPRGV